MDDIGRPSPARRAGAVLLALMVASACTMPPSNSPAISPSEASLEPTASLEPSPSAEPTARPTLTEQITDLLGTWTDGALMAEPRAEVAATVLDGTLYVAGGIDERAHSLTTFERYDPAANAWTALAPLPEPRDHPGLAALNG